MEYIPALEPFRGLLATARFDMRVLYELADDPAVLAAELERAGIEVPGTRMAIVAAVRGAVEEQQRARGPPPLRPASDDTRAERARDDRAGTRADDDKAPPLAEHAALAARGEGADEEEKVGRDGDQLAAAAHSDADHEADIALLHEEISDNDSELDDEGLQEHVDRLHNEISDNDSEDSAYVSQPLADPDYGLPPPRGVTSGASAGDVLIPPPPPNHEVSLEI